MITIIFFNNFKIADTYLGRSGQNCLPNLPSEKKSISGIGYKKVWKYIIWTEILTVLKILNYRGSRGAWFLRNSVFQFLFRFYIKCQIILPLYTLRKKNPPKFSDNLSPLPFKDEILTHKYKSPSDIWLCLISVMS